MYEDWSRVSSSIKNERLVNFLYVDFSLSRTKIVEFIEISVLKTWFVAVFCDFLITALTILFFFFVNSVRFDRYISNAIAAIS